MRDLELSDATHAPTPVFDRVVALPADDTLYVIMRCGSDRAARPVLELLEDIRAVMAVVLDLDALALAFVLDADDAGVGAREDGFSRDYAACLAPEQASPIHHAQWGQGRDGPVGLFVFHDPGTGTGTLEDVLDPLVRQQWPTKWEAADTYLRAHVEQGDRIGGLAAHKKARMGITGQFKFPGGPMTELIRSRKHGLPRERFTGPVSQALVDFLRGVRW
jgi:hypothetical protein